MLNALNAYSAYSSFSALAAYGAGNVSAAAFKAGAAIPSHAPDAACTVEISAEARQAAARATAAKAPSASSFGSVYGLDDLTASYADCLQSKYGALRIESVGRDAQSLKDAAGTMRGGDVVIAPNMLEKMANEPETAERIEGIIDQIHANIPMWEAQEAACGREFESLGVIVHEDGTVTHICGTSDSPERVAEVNRINKEKMEKRAALRRESEEQSLKAAAERERLFKESLKAKEIYGDAPLRLSGDATGAVLAVTVRGAGATKAASFGASFGTGTALGF